MMIVGMLRAGRSNSYRRSVQRQRRRRSVFFCELEQPFCLSFQPHNKKGHDPDQFFSDPKNRFAFFAAGCQINGFDPSLSDESRIKTYVFNRCCFARFGLHWLYICVGPSLSINDSAKARSTDQPPHLFSGRSQCLLWNLTQDQQQRPLALSQLVNRFKMGKVFRFNVPDFDNQGSDLGSGLLCWSRLQDGPYDGPFQDILYRKTKHFSFNNDVVLTRLALVVRKTT
mmetsp:Transcript_345/g.629  ORF Transcript_345/g.629 Transcript_345/m.629 type:complete len:227 (-) Transcript_345:389-1069(-)